MTWTTWISRSRINKKPASLDHICLEYTVLLNRIFAYYNTYISFNDYSYPICEFM